jgi:hypothetical protein
VRRRTPCGSLPHAVSFTLAAHRLGPEQRETIPGPVAMTSSASLVRQLPHCEARSCCHGGAIQQEGPTAVPGDQATDLQLLDSGGRMNRRPLGYENRRHCSTHNSTGRARPAAIPDRRHDHQPGHQPRRRRARPVRRPRRSRPRPARRHPDRAGPLRPLPHRNRNPRHHAVAVPRRPAGPPDHSPPARPAPPPPRRPRHGRTPGRTP